MSKKSKKKKRKKLSSSSSEEDVKVPKRQDDSNNCKGVKRKQDVKSQESCASGQNNSVSSTVKDDSQSTRQIKKPVYRLAKTQATEQKPVNKDERCTKTKCVSVPFHGEKCSSKAKSYVSGEDKTVSGSKTVEREPSKPSETSNVGAVPRRTEKTSKGRFDEKSSQRSLSKLKKQLMSPSLVPAKQEEQKQGVQKKKCTAEGPPRTENDGSIMETWRPAFPVSKDSPQQKRGDLVRSIYHGDKEEELKAKKDLCTDTEKSSATISKKSSTSAKHTTSESSSDLLKNVTSVPRSITSVSQKTTQSSSTQKQKHSLLKFVPFKFKIPKKIKKSPLDSKGENNDVICKNTNLKHGIKPSDSEVLTSNVKQQTVQQAHSCSYLDGTSNFTFYGQDKKSSSSGRLPATDDATKPWYDQVQVVEELHLARSERRLEMNVMESYGELTCMDIDSPEEGPADAQCGQPSQQNLILVLDTNILLSHLDYVKKIRSLGLGALGFPVVLIPWVVLQELDSLKMGRGLSGSVAHLATPAISYIYNSLKKREPHFWGQSMQQASDSCNGLKAENNDDRVLQCCLQYQSQYPECALILCTNDKNLCSKALLSGVKALCKNDLEAEAGRTRHGPHNLQNSQTPTLFHIKPQVPSPVVSRSGSPVQPHSQEKADLSVQHAEKDNKRLNEGDEERTKRDLSGYLSELEDCLLEVLSDVLEIEMKAAFEDLWLEIVYVKPPWTLQDVLQCLKKHWIAVFGNIVPRGKLQAVLNLINFFTSGKTVDHSTTSVALQEAKELVRAFWKSSSRVPGAISVMDNISNKLQPQPDLSVEGDSSATDVVMNDDDEEKPPPSAQVAHQEVWAVFESIWSYVYQVSLQVFKALGFDPHTMQSAHSVGGPPPPHDALTYLHKLSSMVAQLLQAFSSVLSSAPGLEEVQTLLSIIHSNKIINEDSRLTAKDFLDCFSQPEYREKLRVGGSQLMELQEALDRCVRATGQHMNLST